MIKRGFLVTRVEDSQWKDTIKGKKVLVIDDSETVRSQTRILLENFGFDVLVAGNGKEGIEKVRENQDLYLIFSDIIMPELNGVEMLRKLSEENLIKEIPVIMVTTETSIEQAQDAKKVGAMGWIIKPITEEVAESLIKKLGRKP